MSHNEILQVYGLRITNFIEYNKIKLLASTKLNFHQNILWDIQLPSINKPYQNIVQKYKRKLNVLNMNQATPKMKKKNGIMSYKLTYLQLIGK